MYYRPEYNMMMLNLANGQRARYQQSGFDNLGRATQNQVNLQQLLNGQFRPFDNQHANWAFGIPLRYDANHLEILKRNQLILELEKLKMLLQRVEQNEEEVKQALRMEEENKKKVGPNIFDKNGQWKDVMRTREWTLPQIEAYDATQSSEALSDYTNDPDFPDEEPTEDIISKGRPDSPCSNCSSGIGTLPSPLCDAQTPPVFEPRILSSTPLPTADEEIELEGEEEEEKPLLNEDVIMYQGRNILDLHTNLTYQWSFQMAVLPLHNMKTHFEYRSLYHRLSPYGLLEDWEESKCPMCKFNTIVPKQV